MSSIPFETQPTGPPVTRESGAAPPQQARCLSARLACRLGSAVACAPVVVVDRHRRQVRLDAATVGAAALLLSDPHTPPPCAAAPHLEALCEAGLLVVARLEAWLGELLAVVTAAPVEARVGLFSADGVSEHHFWISAAGRGVRADHHEDGTITLGPLPGCFSAASVATLVGLDPAREAPAAGPMHVPPQTLHRFHECLRTGDAPGAAAALADQSGLCTADLELMLDLVSGQCRSWQVTVGSTQLSVVDGGPRGLWCSAAGSVLTLTPTTPLALWQRLVALLPDRITPTGAPWSAATSPSGSSPSAPNDAQRLPCPPPPPTAAPARSCSWTTPTPPASAA